jgi:cytochrome c oxidase subunit 2
LDTIEMVPEHLIPGPFVTRSGTFTRDFDFTYLEPDQEGTVRAKARQQDATGGRRRYIRAAAALGLTGAALTLAGCSTATRQEWARGGFPEPATVQGKTTLHLWQGSWVLAGIVGIFVWGLILWAVVAYRRRPGNEHPVQTQYNIPIEILYTVVPLVIVAGLFYFVVRDQNYLTKVTPDQKLTVNVIGFKWNWGFNYIDQTAYDVGTPNQPAQLYLPVNEKVKFELTSPDVIHSFWVPAFLFKMDVIPGRRNVFELTPNKIGVFSGKCAEFCGEDHSRMLFEVHVVSQAEFDQHIADLKARGQSGLLDTGRPIVTSVPSFRDQSGTGKGSTE